MAIKIRLGKLEIGCPFHPFIEDQLTRNSFGLLDIRPQHVSLLTQLPLHHKDPFDRLLIVQSLAENVAIVGCDTAFDAYGITRHW